MGFGKALSLAVSGSLPRCVSQCVSVCVCVNCAPRWVLVEAPTPSRVVLAQRSFQRDLDSHPGPAVP